MDNTGEYLLDGILTFGVVCAFWLVAMTPLLYGSTWHVYLSQKWQAWKDHDKTEAEKWDE